MKRLIFLLIILVIAILIGIQLKTNPGYVLISTNHVAIETRLWFAIVCVLVLFFVLYFIIRAFKFTFSIPSRWHRWRKKEKQEKATKLTYKGLMDLAQGDWNDAQKYLLKKVQNAPAPLLNYLAAAIAAQRDGAEEKRDQYLQEAITSMPKAKLAVGLVQAQLQYDAAQYEMALATLQDIKNDAPKQKQVLGLLAKVYKKLHDWDKLVEILPTVDKYLALPQSQIFAMAHAAYCHLFKDINDVVQLQHLWKHAPKILKEHDTIVALYIKALVRLHEDEEASKVIRHTLKQHWNSSIAYLYADVDFHPKKQFSHAEAWLKQQPKDAKLLYVLGVLAARNQLWGKAKDYFLDSLNIHPEARTYAAFAALLEELGDIKESLVYYRKGLKASF